MLPGQAAIECPIAQCLKFLSGAWTHNIMWYLGQNPMRFGELRRALQGVSAKVLAERLREMESQGVVKRELLADRPGSGVLYSLTPFGTEFRPIFEAMLKVADRLRSEPKSRAPNPARTTIDDEALIAEVQAEESVLV